MDEAMLGRSGYHVGEGTGWRSLSQRSEGEREDRRMHKGADLGRLSILRLQFVL